MVSVAAILESLRRPLPPVPPAAPLCRSCGVREAVVGDRDPVTCRPCLMRLADVAFHPDRFARESLVDLWSSHADVVDLARVPIDEHLVSLAPLVVQRCIHTALGWVWTAGWPTGDELLADAELDALQPQPDGTWKWTS